MKLRLSLATLLIVLLSLPFLHRPSTLESAALTTVKDTLSSAQLSYFARLGAGVTTANTLLAIGTTNSPNNTTSNLFGNDTVGIGRSLQGGILDNYTVKDIGNTALFSITTGIGVSNAYYGMAVVATRSAIHSVAFTPVSSFNAGIFQFLVKATSRTGETINDGIPDQQGFDLGQDIGATNTGSGTRLKAADVACPLAATASVGTTAVVNNNTYHVVTCTLSAGVSNTVGVGLTMIVGRALASGSQLINPSASVNRTFANEGSADTYAFFVRHLDSGSVVRDTTQGKIAIVEAVRVTATVDPTLTFTIDAPAAVGVGQTRCGAAMSAAAANTTGTAVTFGSLSLGSFNDLAQRLSCITNADHGYVVQVYETDRLKNLSSGDTFADTNCDGGAQACDMTTNKNWNVDVGTSNGAEFGYSLENISVSTTAFNYNSGVGATFAAKPFGIGATFAQTIMSNSTTPTANEQLYICYRATVGTAQPAGNYENQINYVATATF